MDGFMSNKKPYTKKPLSFEKQADLLLDRGLIAEKEKLIIELSRIGYYRLSGYLFYFRKNNSDDFVENTNLDTILHIYNFDSNLRKILLVPLEKVEIVLRTKLAYLLGNKYNSFGYTAKSNLNLNPNLQQQHKKKEYIKRNLDKYEKLLQNIEDSMRSSKEDFIHHFITSYTNQYPPIWIAIELFTLGMTLTMLKSLLDQDKLILSSELDVSNKVFISWIQSINILRNACAHYGRLWKRDRLGMPKIPKGSKYRDWKNINNNKGVFAQITIIHYLCRKYDIDVSWECDIKCLFAKSNIVQYSDYGFPDNWEDSPIWQIDNKEI